MPQLNPEFFVSQIFWLIITFSFLFVFLWKISLPRINSVLERRKNKIDDDIEAAKKLQTEAETIQNNIESKIIEIHKEVSSLIIENSNSFHETAKNNLKKIDDEISKKINESALDIEKNKNESLKDIKNQVHEITKLTLLKLVDINIADKEIEETINIFHNEKKV
tara:strand:+ start:402 stop:896 length:495 start_codon:yes stop_codon:yes gene_type:complete